MKDDVIGRAAVERAQSLMDRADEEYDQLAAPDGTLTVEMNLFRALIALARKGQQAALSAQDEGGGS